MYIDRVRISNFKAIKDTTLSLHRECTVIVGANGSGKSSVLQAMHWIFQSVRNPKVSPNSGQNGSTVAVRDALYMPSQDYRKAGNVEDYASNKQTARLEVEIHAVHEDDPPETAKSWIRSARNEGLSVWAPSGNQIVQRIRDPKREISAYIPGLAGIPLAEEKRSRLVVLRQAAAGDANTVLRNLLLLLSEIEVEERSGLDLVSDYVSQVLGECRLRTNFDEDVQIQINSEFSYESVSSKYVPLEMAGIGFLQVIQIFAYLVYFQPRLLLVDEPDAHLYPMVQEKLVTTLISAAARFETQVVLATHSPSIVRALGDKGTVVWMKDGAVQAEGDTHGRALMGWGLLDKRVIVMTEDEDTEMIRALIGQWPHIDRAVAVWPLNGSAKIPDAKAIEAFEALVGGNIKVLVHRDRDFLMPDEIEAVSSQYTKLGISHWTTLNSDIESYWLEPHVLERHFGISAESASNLLEAAVQYCKANDSDAKVRKKRNDALMKLNRDGRLPQYGDNDVFPEAAKNGYQFEVLGKALMKAIRHEANKRGYGSKSKFGTRIPGGLELAPDLKAELERLINT